MERRGMRRGIKGLRRGSAAGGAEVASAVETEFLRWEATSRDTLDFKRCYVDLTGDLVSGLLLSQIVYWFLPDRDGRSKLTVERDGRRWLAKARMDWWMECRISARQFDRAIVELERLEVVRTAVFRFGVSTTKHITVDFEKLVDLLRKSDRKSSGEGGLRVTQSVIRELHKETFGSDTNGHSGVTETGNPYKEESTAESTAETTAQSFPPTPRGVKSAPGDGIPDEGQIRKAGTLPGNAVRPDRVRREGSSSPVGMAEIRAAWDGVVLELRKGLLLDTRAERKPAWLRDGSQEYERYFEPVLLEDVQAAEGAEDGLTLVLSAPNLQLARNGMKIYAKRVRLAMVKYFGREVQVQWQARGAA